MTVYLARLWSLLYWAKNLQIRTRYLTAKAPKKCDSDWRLRRDWVGLTRVPCNFEYCCVTTATDTGHKRKASLQLKAPVRTSKRFRFKFTGFPPSSLPTAKQRFPSTSALQLAPLVPRTSQLLKKTAFSAAQFNSNLFHFYLFCLFHTHSTKLELQILAMRSRETTAGPQSSATVSPNDTNPSNFHIGIPLLHLFLGNSHRYFWMLQQRVLEAPNWASSITQYSFGASHVFPYEHQGTWTCRDPNAALNYYAMVITQVYSAFVSYTLASAWYLIQLIQLSHDEEIQIYSRWGCNQGTAWKRLLGDQERRGDNTDISADTCHSLLSHCPQEVQSDAVKQQFKATFSTPLRWALFTAIPTRMSTTIVLRVPASPPPQQRDKGRTDGKIFLFCLFACCCGDF